MSDFVGSILAVSLGVTTTLRRTGVAGVFGKYAGEYAIAFIYALLPSSGFGWSIRCAIFSRPTRMFA